MWGERATKLPPGVPVNFWSPTLNNVAWSKDGIIAVAGGDSVALLVPRFDSTDGSDKAWDSVEVRVNIFTDAEVPLMLPLSWKSTSIGEEQSEAFCSALAWSPPGLGKHRRCVLAVLTANHVLALWECTGKPEIPSDWNRVCIINHALQDFIQQHDSDGPEREVMERRIIRQRIRSFSWSPSPLSTPAPGRSGTATALSQPYLAVSNATGEVFIFNVGSPHDLLAPEQTMWNVTVAHSFTISPLPAESSPLASCMPGRIHRQRTFVDQLAWSPWLRDTSGVLYSILAATIESSLHARVVRVGQDDSIQLGPLLPYVVAETKAYPAGAMQWTGKIGADDEIFLLYPCRRTLYCLVFQPQKATSIRVTKAPLDNVWDEVSGMAVTKDSNNNPVVHLTYNQNSVNAKVLGWPLPLTDVEPLALPPWQQSLRDAEALFGQENELQDHVMTRTYGIAVSPLGDLTAINSSNHPTDGVEYVIASDQVSSLRVMLNVDLRNDLLPKCGGPSHPSKVSAESVLFSLQCLSGRASDATIDEDMIPQALLQTLDLVTSQLQSSTPITEDTPIRIVMQQMRENILYHPDSIASRNRKLASFKDGVITSKKPTTDSTMVRRIMTEIVRMPHFISEASDLSQTITHISELVLTKLDARDEQRSDPSAIHDQDVETCEICGKGIAFESLHWARCPNGHQFTRCALSFLSIQTPGTAKFCGICNAQYLNEYLIPNFLPPTTPVPEAIVREPLPNHDGDDDQVMAQKQKEPAAMEPLTSLARILFTAVDRCVRCGGKFVG